MKTAQEIAVEYRGKRQKMFRLIMSGYEPFTEEKNLADSRKDLKSILADEVKACRSRYGRATLHRATPNTGRVTIGRDKESALWCHVTIINA